MKSGELKKNEEKQKTKKKGKKFLLFKNYKIKN